VPTRPAPGTQTNVHVGFARLACSRSRASPCRDVVSESQMKKRDLGAHPLPRKHTLPLKPVGSTAASLLQLRDAQPGPPAPAPACGGTAPSPSCKCSIFQTHRGTVRGRGERHRAQALAGLKRGLHRYQAVLDSRPCKFYSQSHHCIK